MQTSPLCGSLVRRVTGVTGAMASDFQVLSRTSGSRNWHISGLAVMQARWVHQGEFLEMSLPEFERQHIHALCT